MKRILFLIAFSICINIAISQPKVYLRSGTISNTNAEKNPNNSATYFSDCIYDNKYFLWLQFSVFPDDVTKSKLINTGVVLYDYLPDNTFIASFPKNYNFTQLSQYGVYAVCKPLAAYKIDGSLYTPNTISWAVDGNDLKVDVSFTNSINKESFIQSLTEIASFNIISKSNLDGLISIKANISEILKVASSPLVQFIEPIGAPPVLEDYSATANHRINTVQTSDNWTNGKKLDGTGINVAVGDGEMAGTHIDFTGRLLSNTSATGIPTVWHSDHVSGIVCGAGNFNPTYKGQARGANLRVYNYYEPYNLFPSIYNVDSIRVVSHSLGQNCNAGYDANARSSDILIRNYPLIMYVHSAGNSGATNCGGITTYRTITGGYKAGKNVLTVGNLDKGDVINSTSSCGPLPDGRIKPEISSVGTSVNSTQPNNSYVSMDGTSMACPAVTGNMAVLMQAYKVKNNAEANASLLKAILMNTADDLGNDGPDFRYGYGRVNIRKAVKAVEDSTYFSGSVSTSGSNNHTITIPTNVASAKIMVYWADKEATAGASKSLVNNIDAKLVAGDNTEYFPWVIDLSSGQNASTCAAPAVTGIDSVNNMEQIELINPTAGNYTLNVFGKKIPNGPQTYYVVYEFTYNNIITVTHPIGGETFVPGEVQRIRWDACDGTGTFTVSYSLNNGTTWTNASTTVAATRRYYDWTVPAAASSAQALIKVTRGAISDVSDTNFVILKVPTSISFTDVCLTTTRVSWPAVSNAVAYDVFRLEDKYMQLAGSSTTTSLDLLNQDNGVLHWYAVRAKLATKNAAGRLTNAVSHTNTSSVACVVPVKLISFNASFGNSGVNLIWKVASEESMQLYVVEKSITPNFENVEVVGQNKPTNVVGEHQYQLTDVNINSNTTYYYRLKMVEPMKTLYSKVQAITINKWSNKGFSISPNPAKEYINISINSLSANTSKVQVYMYNELGKEVLSKKINNALIGSQFTLTTSNLPSGNYFVTILDTQNKTVIYKEQISVIK